jgi:hypothetical protein
MAAAGTVDPKSILEAGAAGVALITGLAKGGRWLWSRRRSPSEVEIPLVELSPRERSELIDRVKSQRIRNGLDRSLQHAVEMKLGLREAPDLVRLSYQQTPGRSGDPVDLVAAYERAGRQLVILGSPGSGKTTQALLLMRHLLDIARRDPTEPVPEVFQLPSWARERTTLLEWLTGELRRRHGYRPSLGRSLLAHGRIVPVLDGLDEVATEYRGECVTRITEFWESHGSRPLVLCSRLKEYEELPERVPFGGAVTVDPPGAEQIQRYLTAAGPAWSPVRASLAAGDNVTLGRLLATPLMLSVAVLAYVQGDPGELCASHNAVAQAHQLWARYVAQMRTRSHDPVLPSTPPSPAYTEEETVSWLGWLASAMQEANESELWLHEWLGPPAFRRDVNLVSRLGVGLVFGLGGGLGDGLVFGLGGGLIFGLGVGLIFGLVAAPSQPTYRVPFNLRRFTTVLVVRLVFGLVFGLGVGLVVGLRHGPAWGLDFGLVLELVAGLVAGLVVGLLDSGPDRTRLAVRSPTQVIADAGRLGLVAGLGGGLVVGLIFGLIIGLVAGRGGGLADVLGVGLIFGLVAGLPGGLGAVVGHYVYRLLLWRKGWAPLRWPRFLDWACRHLYLRSTGPAYQWVHIELRDHLAAVYAASRAPAARAPEERALTGSRSVTDRSDAEPSEPAHRRP